MIWGWKFDEDIIDDVGRSWELVERGSWEKFYCFYGRIFDLPGYIGTT